MSENTVNPIPEGYHSITPYIVCNEAAKAIDWYRAVFDAEVLARNDGPGGMVMHAEIRIGDSIVQLSDPMPDYGLAAPDPDAVSASLVLYVPDVDAVFKRAVDAGATVREEVSTFVTGDRFASIVDPHGRRWAIMTRVEDVSREEADRRVEEWLASQGQ
jgi:PhnB protein